MTFEERKEKIIQFIKTYGEISSADVQALTDVHRNTASGDLKQLVADGTLLCLGSKKGSSYRLFEETIFPPLAIEKIFPKKSLHELSSFFKVENRKKIFFNKISKEALLSNFSYPKNIQTQFEKMKERIDHKRQELSFEIRKKKKEKLIIDLSWASSNIEGNTYTLLETQNLLKYNQTAKGKSFFEAQMILNHKEAIEYISQGTDYKQITKQKTLELHQILIKNLEVDTGLRTHLVAISNSSFIPCDNQFQIISFFDLIIEKINNTKSVLEKAVMSNLLMAFLQPFSDGNKRTSRMLGNAILLSHGLIPISFAKTPKEDYIKAILYFYEKQNADYFKQLFLNELNNSFREYVGQSPTP